MIRLSDKVLETPSRFKKVKALSTYIQNLREEILKKHGIDFSYDELSELILSLFRSNDFNVISKVGKKLLVNEDRVLEWVDKKLRPNTVIMKLDDEDVMKLLTFSIEITFAMFEGRTRATKTQKGLRERERTFESIVVDQFVGKLGEIMVKRFLEEKFPPVKIELDWEISTEIERYRNDILNARKNVSIKTTSNLAGIWAEADKGYDYGIMVKCSVPSPPLLQFFIEVCGFSQLLKFAEERISYDNLFKEYIERIRERIKGYKCGEIRSVLKGFICGYFKTQEYPPKKKGEKLEYLGEVKEERHFAPIQRLKWTKEEWKEFLKDNELL